MVENKIDWRECLNKKIAKPVEKDENLIEGFQGWYAYAKWANSHNLINKILRKINL